MLQMSIHQKNIAFINTHAFCNGSSKCMNQKLTELEEINDVQLQQQIQ